MYFISIAIAAALAAIPIAPILFYEREHPSWGKYVYALAMIVLAQSVYTGPMYNVWEQTLQGKAELERAEYSRKITIAEAKAKEEAAKSWANAEIERARGSNEANEIMKKSLGGTESYLRWLFIEKLDHIKSGQIIYLPTEAGMPILEAGKR